MRLRPSISRPAALALALSGAACLFLGGLRSHEAASAAAAALANQSRCAALEAEVAVLRDDTPRARAGLEGELRDLDGRLAGQGAAADVGARLGRRWSASPALAAQLPLGSTFEAALSLSDATLGDWPMILDAEDVLRRMPGVTVLSLEARALEEPGRLDAAMRIRIRTRAYAPYGDLHEH